MRHSLRLSTLDAIFANPLIFLIMPGNFIMTGLVTSLMGVGEKPFGWMVALFAIANVIQVLIMPVLSARWNARQITLFSSWSVLAVWTAMGFLIPYLVPVAASAPPILPLLLFFALSSLFQSWTGVSWIAWIRDIAPERLRGKYFGFRNRWGSIVTVLFLLSVGGWMKWRGACAEAYQEILLFACAARVISILAQHGIPRHPLPHTDQTTASPLRTWKQVFAAQGFMKLLLFSSAVGFCHNLFYPFIGIFLYRHIGMDVSGVSVLLIIASLSSALAMPFWGRLMDRHGNKPITKLGLLVWQAPNILFCFVTPDRQWMLYPIWCIAGIFGSAFMVGSFNLMLKLVPNHVRTGAISIHVACSSLTAALAPVLGGWLIETVIASGMPGLTVYHAVYPFSVILIWSCVLLLMRVPEPAATPLTELLGAMRPFRLIASVAGLANIIPHLFFRSKK